MTGYLHTPTGPGMLADHERRLRELERALRPKQTDLGRAVAAGAGGKPYATVVVAAFDSTAADKANADYVCDGTADQEEINAAIASCTVGGRVLLLEGTYYCSAPVYNGTRGVSVHGMGSNASVLYAVPGFSGTWLAHSDSAVATCNWVDLGFDAGFNIDYPLIANSGSSVIERCHFTGGLSGGLQFAGIGSRVVACVASGNEGVGIFCSGSDNVMVLGCHSYGNAGHGIGFSAPHESVVSGCVAVENTGSGIYSAGAYCSVTGNVARRNGLANIDVTGAGSVAVGNAI